MGLHSFRNIRRMEARWRKASAFWLRHSQSGVIVDSSRNPTLKTSGVGVRVLPEPVSLGGLDGGLADEAPRDVEKRESSSVLWQFVGVGRTARRQAGERGSARDDKTWLNGMQDAVGPEGFDGLLEGKAAMEAKPFAGVTMPLYVEAVAADPVSVISLFEGLSRTLFDGLIVGREIAAPTRWSLPSCSRPSRTLRAAGAVARRRAILDRRCARRRVARAGRVSRCT